MAKTKIALLYERLSCDDELQGESFSIQNHDYIEDAMLDIRRHNETSGEE